MERPFKQSDPRATFREVFFTAVDAAAVNTPLQLSDMNATFTIYLVKNAVAPALLVTPTITQLDATNTKGLFRWDMTAGNIDTPGNGVAVITNTGGTKTMLRREIWFSVDPAYFFTATGGGHTTSSVTTDRAETTVDYWKNALILCHSGVNTGQIKRCDAYSAGKAASLASGQVWTTAPSNGDIFQFIVE